MIPRGYRKRLDLWGGRLTLLQLAFERRLLHAVGLRAAYHRRVARLVRATGLFDAGWYLDSNADVLADGVDPLLHYASHGDREGRLPMPLFDPMFYRAHAGELAAATNTLLHYCHVGRFLKKPASAWFDTEFYLRQNRDVSRSRADPLRHYLEWGGVEGRSPCKAFDSAFYLRSNPDVAQAGVNPLLHYLRFGRREGRLVTALGLQDLDAVGLPLPYSVPEGWENVPRASSPSEALVDVVVPVFKGRPETLRCLRSVLDSRNETPFELVVIDDGTPDLQLRAILAEGAEAGLFTLLSNQENLGFVATANRGMELHPGRDVVLLNADTEVFGDWIDRLRRAAVSDPHIATVTPLSNNATITSYPRFLHDNPYPLEISFRELDALTARVNAATLVETPTGVGFCMYLRRECLRDIGLFDLEAFGRGYGEENDLCQRAILAGWRNVVAANIFVHHLGSVSFQGERTRRIDAAMRVLGRRHPGYHRDVRDFIERDPLAEARRRLDWARLARDDGESSVLMVCHSRGGGAERALREDAARITADGQSVYFLRPVPEVLDSVQISDPRQLQLPNQPYFSLQSRGELAEALRVLRVSRILVHGTVDFPLAAPAQLVELAREIGAELELDIHDYQVLCPRINLAGEDGVYCGEPDEAGCNACLLSNGSKYNARNISEWRAAHAGMLAAASVVRVPDADVSERLLRYHPGLPIVVEPHGDLDLSRNGPFDPLLGDGEALHVVVIGAIGKIKGFEPLLGCARDARERGLPLRFAVLGYSMDDAALISAGVAVSGRYLEPEASQRLAALAAHLVWLPSLWPETFSYTLSVAFASGHPVWAFDIGAIARRLRDIGREQALLSLDLQADPRAINDRFLAYRERCVARPRVVVA